MYPLCSVSNFSLTGGKIIAIPTSSHIQDIGTHPVPVKLISFGSIFMIECQNSNSHLGILSDARLVSMLDQLPLKLDATLLVSDARVTKGGRKAHMKKYTSTKTTRNCSIRIVVYGLRDNEEATGRRLSAAGLFLQHPYATEVIPGVKYHNPHYLVRPGGEMPKLENLQLDDTNDDPHNTEAGGEMNKSHFMRIFETAQADGGGTTAADTLASPRLRSRLMRYDAILY